MKKLLMTALTGMALAGTPSFVHAAPLSADTVQPQADKHGYIVRVGQKAPDFTIQYLDGTKKRLSELRGKVVLLQFTASWCGVCRKEMPYLEKQIWQKHKNNPDFVLLGIDRDEPADVVKKFGKTTGVTYPLTLDPGADIFGLFALKQSGITRNVLIDAEGNIVMLTRLFDEAEFQQLVQKVDDMLR